MRLMVLLLGGLIFLLLCPSARAQAVVRGTVLDSISGRPLHAAIVSLVDAQIQVGGVAMTDSSGGFSLRVPSTNSYSLRVEREGYTFAETSSFSLPRGRKATITFRLPPAPLTLDPLTVTAPNRHMRSFLERRDWGWGRFLDPTDLARSRPTDFSTLMQRVQGLEMRTLSGFSRSVIMNARGCTCVPTVYVDGIRAEKSVARAARPEGRPRACEVRDGLDPSEHVNISSVRAVEFYPNPVHAPGEFRGLAECGVLILWTDWGLGYR